MTSAVRPFRISIPPARSSPAALALLVLANAVPLAGVLLWDWRIGDVVILYWIENLIVGAYNVLRILVAQIGGAGRAFLAGFFAVHYGFFCFVHGTFLASLFPVRGPDGARLDIGGVVLDMLHEPGLLFAVAALAVSHGVSFVRNYLGRGEYRTAEPKLLMHRPYGRIIVVHLFILAGGFLVQALASPLSALVLFVVLKTAIDLGMHRRERRLLATPPAAR